MVEINDFLGNLGGVVSDNNGGWMACCPAHDDKNASLHVTLGNDGRILLKCHAGCETSAVLGAMGLTFKDIMPENGKAAGARPKRAPAPSAITPEEVIAGPTFAARKRKDSKGKLVCEYLYENAEGKVVFKVQRFQREDGRKTFVQMTPDPHSDFQWRYGVSRHGVDYLPYHLPSVIKAAEAGHIVVIFEGEKDVDNARQALKVAATCNPCGAGKWLPGWGKYFKGARKILIIADKDRYKIKDPKTGEDKIHAPGQRHACDVEAKLIADGFEGEIVKAVLPDVKGRHVKDFTDWLIAMQEEGQEVNAIAFADAVRASGEWPKEWEFGKADGVDLRRAQKESARDSASVGDEEKPDAPADGMGDAGRFGRLDPRSPSENERKYMVDLHIDKERRARFIIGVDSFQFEPWRSDDKGKTFERAKPWEPMAGTVSQFIGMAEGCLFSFCGHNRNDYKFKMAELTCGIIVAWLQARGRFFADHDNPCYESSMYFNSENGMLYGLHSAEFQSWLATQINIARKIKIFDLIMSVIDDLALDEKLTPRVVPSRQWERRGDAVYLSSGDSEMYRVKGGKIDLVQNGTDGVVFLRGYTLAPWKLLDGKGLDPFSNAIVFKSAAWADDHSLMNVRMWYLNLFANHKNKPLLLIEGPAGSGKTTIARLIKALLSMRDRGKPDSNVNIVANTDKAAEDFWVIVHNGRLEVFDNLDQKIKWANNELQTVSTGGSHKGRKLYETDDTYILYANSYIIITSNNPIFATEGGGLPDRIIQGHLKRGRSKSLDNELNVDIEKHRDEFMTWTARTLAAALLDQQPVEESINSRHPDYGIFAVKCARALGCEQETIKAMCSAEIDKSVLPLTNHAVAREIYNVLMQQDPPGSMKFYSGEMSDVIIQGMDESSVDETTKKIYGSRPVGKALSTFEKEFSVIFKMLPPRVLEGKKFYEFQGLTPQGQTIASSSGG